MLAPRFFQWLVALFDARRLSLAVSLCAAVLFGPSSDAFWSLSQPVRLSTPPPPGGTPRDVQLRVGVRGLDRAPLAGARARVYWERSGVYFEAGSAESDASGNVTLSRLPRGVLWLLVEAPGYGRASLRLLLSPGMHAQQLELAPAHSLGVRVRDETGAPLSDATVLVTSADPLPYGALTNSSGEARLEHLSRGSWSVKASARGYESVTRNDVSGDLELVLRRLGSLSVRVLLPDGTPAAGADIAIAGVTLWPARSTEADASGTAKISGLLAGSYDLRASRENFVSRVLHGFVLERGANEELTLVLEPGRFVTALVTEDEAESPVLVPHADVVLAEEGLSVFPLRGRSGSDGKVVLGPISSGPATLSARAGGFVSSAVVAVPGDLAEPVPVRLRRGGTITGEVRDARGFPVDGASIEIVGSDAFGLPIAETPQLMRFRNAHFNWAMPGPAALIAAGELGVMPGPVPPIPGSRAALALQALDAETLPLDAGGEEELAPWVTNASGRFSANPVTPGRVRALVRHPDYVESVSAPVMLAPGGKAELQIVLLRGGALEGRVLDERQRPVEGAEVEAIAERGSFQRVAITESGGRFAFAALPAELTLNVRRPESPMRIARRLPVRITEGSTAQLDIELAAVRDSLRVIVSDQEGRPVELAEVSALSLDPVEPLRATEFSGRDGAVMLEQARGLELRLSAQAPGFARRVSVVSARTQAAELRLELERAVTVRGRITSLSGRRGVEGAFVLLSSQGQRRTATSNADGDYEITQVTPGKVQILVSHPEFADAELDAELSPPTRSDRAVELAAVDLREPARVEGEVVDESGAPVAGARVGSGQPLSFLPAGPLPRGVTLSDAQGRFSLSGVSPGAVSLEAYAPERGRGRVEVELFAGRSETGVRIVLRGGGAENESYAPGGVAVTLGERGSGASLEVVVVNVAQGSEAERGGLAHGDVLRAIDGAVPSSMQDARARLSGALPSDVVLTIARAGAEQRLSVAREPVRR
jgi:hypothetical protein